MMNEYVTINSYKRRVVIKVFERVRPVIIVVENTPGVVSDVKKIFESINKGYFWEDFEITVDVFEILTDVANKEPCFVNYKDVSYFPKIVDSKDFKTVDLNPLFDYLCKFEFLNKNHIYVQPIVLFALDGSVNYSFDDENLCNFKKSYIYSDSLRPLSFRHFDRIGDKHRQTIDALMNKGKAARPFLAFAAYTCLTYAFWLIETMPKGETDVIVPPSFPTDVIIKNGEICRRRTKSIKKIARWKNEIQEYNRRYRF